MANKGQISYTPPMEIEILKAVQTTRVHVALHGEGKIKLNEGNIVFASDHFAHVKAQHYEPGNHKKVKSKYLNMTEKTMKTNGWGAFYGGTTSNLSGFDGDLAQVATRIKAIQFDIETADAANKAKLADEQAQKENLTKISKEVFDTKPNKGKQPRIKSIGGNIIERELQRSIQGDHWRWP